MDFSNSQDSLADSAYSPQILNEVDTNMGDAQDSTGRQVKKGAPRSPAHEPIDYTQTRQALSPPLDTPSEAKYPSPNPAHQQQPSSRPGSGMAGQQGQYQDQNRQPQQPNKSSVVIKVGMVGDAQIGKTSLMVKYVEGSWDEDYIQTLGW